MTLVNGCVQVKRAVILMSDFCGSALYCTGIELCANQPLTQPAPLSLQK